MVSLYGGLPPPDEQAPVSVLRDRTVGTDADVEGRRTLVGLLEQVAERTSVSGLSRFLAEAPWDTQAVGQQWLKDFRAKMQPVVEAEHERQRRTQPKRRGRPKQPLVTGYLIGDDSTMHEPTGSRSGL